MCRHLVYLGPELPLRQLLTDPPFALVRQAWAPRRQTHGVVNADGFGVGWYVPGDPVPARHRGAGPVWADQTFADLARVVRSGAVLAAVRSATAGAPPAGASAAAPFRSGPWLFSHNGAVPGWPEAAPAVLDGLDRKRLAGTDTSLDSAALWALVQDRLEAGAPPGQALADVVRHTAATAGGRLNLLLTDGRRAAATAWGASLSWRPLGAGAVIASEPYDDDPAWQDVPEHTLAEIGPGATGVRFTAL